MNVYFNNKTEVSYDEVLNSKQNLKMFYPFISMQTMNINVKNYLSLVSFII